MIAGGNATVHVSSIDAAVSFYGATLGLKITNRFADRWATVHGGPSYWTTDTVMAGLIIGLHPPAPHRARPGARGGVMIGLETYTPIERAVETLSARGVRFTSDIVRYEAGHSISLEDHEGNPMYLHEFPPFMLDGADATKDAGGSPLVSGGHATVFVSNMNAAIRFYTQVLGLRLTNRYDDHFATVEAGRELVIGIHPRWERFADPGTKGATLLGLTVDEPIARVMSQLAQRGVKVNPPDGERAEIELSDPDGNVIVITERAALRLHGVTMAVTG